MSIASSIFLSSFIWSQSTKNKTTKSTPDIDHFNCLLFFTCLFLVYLPVKPLPGHLCVLHLRVCVARPSLLQSLPRFLGEGLLHLRERS